ncbi:ABC transporter substrate-binding protein [Streptomyces sp. NBC_00829]|uniref:ABC transporter substrate-binding protein n=1 Tax=Streptomyces sp. NBC_00829 TaxID=2903679 RepID=UPI00386C8A6D|nr:ABC transporter substrate-binding protein [Streptomyces sp. NBC_00829]
MLLALVSCSAADEGAGGQEDGFNAGNRGVVNASDRAGGTVTYQLAGTPDSMDPGNTYYGYMWNFSRLYGRPLTTFASEPGSTAKLVPDLATGLGTVSDGGRTWTYRIRSGLKYSDGSPITSRDVKYAIERSNYAPEALSNGPTYFRQYLVDNQPPYAGPYRDRTGGLKSIETPDDTTIIFHLSKPFADFDYLVSNPQSAPVPRTRDTGAGYVNRIVSSGAYMFASYQEGAGATLVRNPHWSSASDPLRKQYADKIVVQFNREQSTVDQNLIAGTATLDLHGEGIAASTQATVLSDPTQKAHVDVAQSGLMAYVAMSSAVPPLDNVHCRRAVEYAVDRGSVQTAAGGSVRGEIATTILPPSVIGHTAYDLYPTSGHEGANSPDGLAAAKRELTLCGHPGGFSTNLAARADQPNEIAMAQAVQASLKRAGIDAAIQQYPSGTYASNYAGAPAFVRSHQLGLMMMQWAADWPTGYGFMDQILNGNSIKASGNTNFSELNDPQVNRMLAQAINNPDAAARTKAWGDIDKTAMRQAPLVPLLYLKSPLYRPAKATNVFVTPAYGMYDYLTVGQDGGR